MRSRRSPSAALRLRASLTSPFSCRSTTKPPSRPASSSTLRERDYPRAKLEIQVLDDSTDETRALNRSLVAKLQERE